jgi:hypothetical protein
MPALDGQAGLHINIKDMAEIARWAEHWQVTEVELRKAIAEVGTGIVDLGINLGKSAYGGSHLHQAGMEGGGGYSASA